LAITFTHMHDIAIIGAGPAGSLLASSLADKGWQVALVERRTLPQHKVCGEFLSPEAQGTLRRAGLFQTLASVEPQPLYNAAIIDPQGHQLQVELPGAACGLSRYTMDLALLEAAAARGVTLYCPAEALGFAPTEAGWSMELRIHGERSTLLARSLVIACGRHGRAGLRSTQGSGPGNYVGVTCHYNNLSMPAQVSLYLFPGGYVGLNPVEGGRVNMGMLVQREAFQRAGATLAGIIAAAERANPAYGAMVEKALLDEESLLAVAPVSTNAPAAPWERVARVGDAVSMIPPLCGDGMAMALRSAELCATLADSYLAGRISLSQWEQDYREQWRREFRTRLAVGRGLERLFMNEALRSGAILLGRMVPGLAGMAVRTTRGM
jgi:menaquinone-9 beta-reductase